MSTLWLTKFFLCYFVVLVSALLFALAQTFLSTPQSTSLIHFLQHFSYLTLHYSYIFTYVTELLSVKIIIKCSDHREKTVSLTLLSILIPEHELNVCDFHLTLALVGECNFENFSF